MRCFSRHPAYRNPTSIDEEVFVREFWLRYGQVDRQHRKLTPWAWYVEAGKAPRFAKQVVRHLESYGLWGTAVNRFEIPQLQVGVNLGGSFYFRGQYGIGAPLFMRDPNALAGDNGTEDRVPGNVNPQVLDEEDRPPVSEVCRYRITLQ